jgi:hypothetical protein
LGAELLVILYAVFALVGCGRSGGGRPTCDGWTLSGFCLEHSVGGSVSGLAGSGLVLFEHIGGSDGSDAISQNGSFTLQGTHLSGEPYHVIVSSQPINPPQSCVVTNGSGVVGSSNVRDISIVCTTRLANANLTGTYTAVRYDYSSTGDSGGLWTVIFDGAGNFSGTETLNNVGMVSSVAVSGTYTVAADGALHISPSGGSTITGGLSADGNTWVASQTTSGHSPSILVGILR